ncbi:MAG TPA: chemotaxis-specific protein-glutamate methyltransferase CheB [Roseiflexaceae bacterium]|nr:chemotaxis-specific protein-glutamate methyltransferase CheB [Roseiflexaceae bacterium]
MNQPIKVVIVDDSALMRRVVTELLEQDSGIQVIGTASNGREAITLVEATRPDLVIMDVRMPVMDGLEATEHLMAYCPTPILVLTASLARYDIDITFKMLGAGALEVMEKPSGVDVRTLERAGHDLRRRVKVLARVRVVTHIRGRRKQFEGQTEPPARLPQPAPPQPPAPPNNGIYSPPPMPLPGRRKVRQGPLIPPDPSNFPVIVIGASTGGPRVVFQILTALPHDLPAAVLVVQHIAAGFSGGMVEWLATASAMPIKLAEEGGVVHAGEVLVAPDQRDLLITRTGTTQFTTSPLLIQRPAIDVTMQAAAEVFGPRVIGVLLTGMGRDGAYGMLTIKRAGGYTIAQDEATCTIFGMPRAAIELDAAQEVLPQQQIAARLVELVYTRQQVKNV